MRKRIKSMLMLIAASAILLTAVLLTIVYYNLLREQDIQVTCIDNEGKVIYDNLLESQDASGENTFYYVGQLPDGSVLRVSREADSVYQMFIEALPGVLTALAIVLLGGLLVGTFLTLYFIPVLYSIVDDKAQKRKAKKERKRLKKEEKAKSAIATEKAETV